MMTRSVRAGAPTSSRGSPTGIRLVAAGDLTPEQKAHLSAFFAREVWPVLTPLAVDPGHPFPMLRNRSLNLAVFCTAKDKTGRRETMVAVVQVPAVLPRLAEVPCRRRPARPMATASPRRARRASRTCCSKT